MLHLVMFFMFFGQAPLCFTSDDQMNWAVAYSLQLFSSHSHALPPPLWSAGQAWTETWTPREAEPPPSCVARSKRLSASVSHSAAALCVCISDSRTATYCVVLVFAFGKAATVSLVFVRD